MPTFDDSPILYYTIGNLLLILTGVLSVYSFWNSKLLQNRGWIITALCFLILVMMRLPVIVINQAFNLDESLFIVGAMTLVQEPVYWESVDGSTSGPFNFYVITFFCELFDQPYDYISARTVGIILMIGSVGFSFLALQKLFSQTISFLCIFPVVAFLGTTSFPDFIHYSSEHLPIFLLSILTFLYAVINNQPQVKSSTALVFGLVAAIIPLTKLQAIPIGAFLTLATYWLIYHKNPKKFIKPALWLTFGGCSVLLITSLSAISLGVIDNIWFHYLKYNLSYGSKTSIFYTIYKSLFDDINIFIRIIIILVDVLFIYHILIKQQLRPTSKSVLIIAFLTSTIFSVYKTGLVFEHYLLFLIFPTAFLYAFFLNDLINLSKKIQATILLSVFVVAILSKTLIYPMVNHYVSAGKSQRPLPISAAGKEIIKYSKPHESLVVWGEAGELYLETKKKQGIKWSHTLWGMHSDSAQKEFQNEFIKEFARKSFPVFVDSYSTTNTFMTRDKLGYETKPVLKDLIESKYKLVGDFDGQRVFVRNERYSEVNHNITDVSEPQTK